MENDNILNKSVLEKWKKTQKNLGIAPGTLTNRVVRINHFLSYMGCEELCFSKGGKLNLTGKRFGNLIVIEMAEGKSSDRSIRWKCRCLSCGKIKEISANQLTKGVQISCGCNRKKRLQETNGYVEGTCLKSVFSEKINKNNTSGYKGVFQKRGKWGAKIQYKKKSYYLGTYERFEDAVAARKQAECWVRDDAAELIKKLEIPPHKC